MFGLTVKTAIQMTGIPASVMMQYPAGFASFIWILVGLFLPFPPFFLCNIKLMHKHTYVVSAEVSENVWNS